MSELTFSRTFACTPSTLWSYVSDPKLATRWLEGVESYAYTSPPPVREGSTFEMKIKEGRSLTTYEGAVVAWEPERRLGLRMKGGCGPKPMTIHTTYLFTPAPSGGTTLEYRVACELPKGLLWSLMGWLGKAMMKRMTRRFFDNLARQVESPAAAATR